MFFYFVIPVYNSCEYLSNCIDSILRQNQNNYKIILVNDGSTDNSGEICDKYSEMYENIFVIHKKNEGAMKARNAGINYVLNECDIDKDFILFVDSDDLIKENMLSELIEVTKKNNSDLIIYGFEVLHDNIITYISKQKNQLLYSKREKYCLLIEDQSFNSLCRKAVRCKLFENLIIEINNVELGEDLIQSIPLIERSNNVLVLDKILYVYRNNEQSITHKINLNRVKNNFLVSTNYFYHYLCEENFLEYIDWIKFYQRAFLDIVANINNVVFSTASHKEIINVLIYFRKNKFYIDVLKNKINKVNLSFNNRIIFLLFNLKLFSLIIFLKKIKRNK